MSWLANHASAVAGMDEAIEQFKRRAQMDEINPQQGAEQGPLEPKVVATLIITFSDDGSVRADGPLNNKLLSYGLLESAKDIVRDYHGQMLARQAMLGQMVQGQRPVDVMNPLGPRA